MKPLYLALLIVASCAVAVVVSLYGSTTKIVSFAEADELAKESPDQEYHIYCKLNKSKEVEYNPQEDPNYMAFYAIDSLGTEKKVVYHKAKPQNFEHAEKILLNGHSKGEFFEATTIFSKCPSKYKDAPVNTEL